MSERKRKAVEEPVAQPPQKKFTEVEKRRRFHRLLMKLGSGKAQKNDVRQEFINLCVYFTSRHYKKLDWPSDEQAQIGRAHV